jgi:tetratricopeptide (TPR) repeat protein
MFKEEHAMQCNGLRHVVLSVAILAMLSVTLATAQEGRRSSETAWGSLQIKDSDDATANTAVPELNTTKADAPAKAIAPTPAKHKPAAISMPDAMTAQSDAPTAPASKEKISADPIRPIPDAAEGAPVKLEAASFKGVTPGVSTKTEVEKAWGKPKETASQDETLIQLYSVGPFKRIEVSYSGGKVTSVVIRFERTFPVAGVAKQLDLLPVRSVLISNDVGEVLGTAYPERGVVLAFEPGKEPNKPSMKVKQIVLEPITAEPFVLRAETTLETRPELSRRDLEQAIALEPENARARWLYSRVLTILEQQEKAAAEAGKAVRLEPDNAIYLVTRSQALAQIGKLPEAIREVVKAAELSEKQPHIKARALCLAGDLAASGDKPDYKKALAFHTQAIQLADALASDQHPAIRTAAKEVLVDAHLGAAHDIAWGDWKDKNKAVLRWLERAQAAADDLVNNEDGSHEHVFHVYTRAMTAYAGVRGSIDPEPTVQTVISTGDELVASTRDPIQRARIQKEIGSALYDAMQIFQLRSDADNAAKCGQQAAMYLVKANDVKSSPASSAMLGRLYFRLGVMQAVNQHDHHEAVAWFEKATPLLDRAATEDAVLNIGRHGETFVSMGVSYWEVGQRKKAVALTNKGIKWMEQAVRQGEMDRSAIAVAYTNLAAMHQQLGATELADHYQEMASRAKQEKIK